MIMSYFYYQKKTKNISVKFRHKSGNNIVCEMSFFFFFNFSTMPLFSKVDRWNLKTSDWVYETWIHLTKSSQITAETELSWYSYLGSLFFFALGDLSFRR